MPNLSPANRERLLATATFAGIALATIIAIDFLATGGFDFGARRSSSHYTDPFAFAAASVSQWVGEGQWTSPQGTATTVSWTQPEATLADDIPAVANEELDGDRAAGDARMQEAANYVGPSDEELHREIEALYAAQDPRAHRIINADESANEPAADYADDVEPDESADSGDDVKADKPDADAPVEGQSF